MKRFFLFLPFISMTLFLGCAKELSFETSKTVSQGSLQSDVTGECLPKTVSGAYVVATPLAAANNYIEVQVNVTLAGSYDIRTDTVNGVSFKGAGVFTSPGLNTVKLAGNGTPFTDGIYNFIVSYAGTTCAVAITVLPEGAGGPAVMTLAGAPNACMNATVAGLYVAGSPVSLSNNVVINVDVTGIGTYDITTVESDGLIFKGSGAFISEGPKTITLTASGTPQTAGDINVLVTVGSSSCSFPVTVKGPAQFTIDCGSATVTGEYFGGLPLDASNTVELPVSVATEGAYDITTTIHGMTFSGSGALTSGANTIILTGSGTPDATGTFDVPVSAGSSNCTFPVEVQQGITPASGTWKFTAGGTTFQGTFAEAIVQSQSPLSIAIFGGVDNVPGSFNIGLLDVADGIQGNETYPTNETGFANSGLFSYESQTLSLEGDPSDPALMGSIIFKVTSHNTGTKTIVGTFSGGSVDALHGNAAVPITSGEFTVTYQ